MWIAKYRAALTNTASARPRGTPLLRFFTEIFEKIRSSFTRMVHCVCVRWPKPKPAELRSGCSRFARTSRFVTLPWPKNLIHLG